MPEYIQNKLVSVLKVEFAEYSRQVCPDRRNRYLKLAGHLFIRTPLQYPPNYLILPFGQLKVT